MTFRGRFLLFGFRHKMFLFNFILNYNLNCNMEYGLLFNLVLGIIPLS